MAWRRWRSRISSSTPAVVSCFSSSCCSFPGLANFAVRCRKRSWKTSSSKAGREKSRHHPRGPGQEKIINWHHSTTLYFGICHRPPGRFFPRLVFCCFVTSFLDQSYTFIPPEISPNPNAIRIINRAIEWNRSVRIAQSPLTSEMIRPVVLELFAVCWPTVSSTMNSWPMLNAEVIRDTLHQELLDI